MAHLKLITAPAESPVTVAEAKAYLRVDGSSEDARIQTMISAATKRLEDYCDTKFIEQEWAQYMDCWPNFYKEVWWDGVREMPVSELYTQGGIIQLLTGPVTSVEEFNTYADNGTPILFASNQYIVDTTGPFGRISLPIGGVWPPTILRKVNGIEIKFTAGLADSAANLAADVKQAVLEYVANMFEKRGDESKDKTVVPNASLYLLEPYRRFKTGGRLLV